jgi:subtilisin-like proprotein convertase family protein
MKSNQARIFSSKPIAMIKIYTNPTSVKDDFKTVKSNFYKYLTKISFCAMLLIGLSANVLGQAQSSTFTTTGTSYWLCPAGVTSVTVKCYGAGGGGGRRGTTGVSGGGGGGAYASSTISVTPGTIYPIFVGAGGVSGSPSTAGGDSYFSSAATVMAKGGSGLAINTQTGGTAGLASASVGSTKYDGGTGGTGSSSNAGKGGGGAGTGGAGQAGGVGSTNGAGTATGGGNGGNGKTATQGDGTAGSAYGGGGGGCYRTSGTKNGGAGANGAVIVEWTGAAYVAPSSVNLGSQGTTTSTTLTEDVFFYDNGGSGANYNGSTTSTTIHTFYPKSCCKIQVEWVSYTLENCACDYLTIFDGNSTSAASLGAYANSNPGTKISTAADGSLTFQLATDANTDAAGWYAILRNVPVSSGPPVPTGFTGNLLAEVGGTETYSVTNVSGITHTWAFPAGWVINSGQGTNSVSVTPAALNGTISCTPSKCGYSGTAYTTTSTIPNYRWKYVSSSLGALTWSSGESRNLDITIKNTGLATWNSTYTNNIGVRWNTTNSSLTGSPWNDFHSRTSVGSLAPGSSNTFTLPIQAKNATGGPTYSTNLSDGTYYLAFDVVSEGQCWFNGNSGTCGPGNVVFYSAAQTVTSTPTIAAGSLTAFGSVCLGSTATNSFTLSGVNLTNNISLAALTGYTYSLTAGGSYTSTLTVPHSGGLVNETVYVKFTPVANTTYSGNIVASSSGASSVNVAASGTGSGPTSVSAGADVTVCSGTSTGLSGSATEVPGVATTLSASPNLAIPDANATGVSSTISISNSGLNANQITSISFTIPHAYTGDVDITLIAPNGSTIDVSSDNGGAGVNYTSTVISTSGTAITSGSAPFTGTYTPEQAFSTLTGTANGNWILKVVDDASGDVGTFSTWSITYTPSYPLTYSWSPATFLSSTTVSNPTATSVTSAQTYTMTATSNGCSASDQVIVSVNSLSVAPTSVTGTNNICSSSSTTLTANGGTAGYEAEYVWYPSACPTNAYTQEWTTQPFGLTSTTQNSLTNGILNVTSTTVDPMIDMSGLGSFDPNTYRYINIRYKVVSGTANGVEIFFYNGTHGYAVGGETGYGTLISDNTWRTLSVDMWTDAEYRTGGNIVGWRFDWATASGVTMDIDFITLSNQPILGSGSTLSVTPASTTNYYASYAGGCNTTSCATIAVTVQPTLSLGTVTTGGSTSICYNTAPTGITASGATGSGSFSYQWYYQAGAVTPTSGSLTGWTAVSGQTTTSLTASAITANTTYACWVTPGGTPSCGSANWAGASNNDKVQITVYSNFTTGTILSTGQSICSGGDPSVIGSSVASSGGDNSITYEWRANGTPISSTNSATYDPPIGLITNTTYTRWAKDATCNTTFTQSSGSWIVTVSAPSVVTSPSTNDFVWNGTTSTAWNVTSNWLQWNGSSYVVPASYPNANTANVILPSTSSCVFNTVAIPAGTFAANNLTVESGQTLFLSSATSVLNIAGTFTMSGTWTTPTSGSVVSFNGAGSQTIPALTYDKLQTATGGTKTLAGTTTANNVVTIGASSTLDLSSNTLNLAFVGTPLVATGTFTASTGTVYFNAAGNQTIPALTYNTLQCSTSGTKTLASGTTNVNGVLTVNSGIVFASGAGRTLNLSYVGIPMVITGSYSASTGTTIFNASGAQTIPATTYSNLETAGSGAKTIAGTTTVSGILTIGSGTTFGLSTFSLRMTKAGSGLIVNNGTWDYGTGTVDFRTASDQTIPALTYYSLTTTTGGIKTLSGTTTVNNLLTIGASTTLQLSSYTLNLARLTSTPITNNGTFDAGTGAVVMSANGTQLIPGLTYYNLISNSTGTKTLNGTTVINGILTLTTGTVAVGSQSLTLNGPYIQGTVNNLTTTASSSLVFNCPESGPFTLPASTLIGNLTINSSGQSYNMNSNFTLSGSLTLTEGTLNVGTRTLTYSGSNITRTNGTIDASNTSGLLSFTNASALSLPASVFTSSIGKLTVNGAGGVTLGSNTTVSNTLTLTSGTLTTGPNSLIMNGSTLTRTSGSIDASNGSATMEFGNSSALSLPASVFTGSVNNLTLNGAGGITLGSNTTVNGNLTLTSGSLTVGANTLTYGGSSITRTSGNIIASNGSANVTFTNGSALTLPSSLFSGNVSNLTMNGAGGVTLGDAVTVTTSIDLTSGDLTLGANTLNFNGSTLTRTSGTIDASNSSALINFGNTSALTLPSSVFSGSVNDMTLSANGGVTLGSNLTIAGDLILSAGTLSLGSTTLTFDTDATMDNTTGFINSGTGKVVFKAATLDGSVFASSQANDLEVNRPSGTVAISNNIEVLGDFTMTSGTVDLSTSTLKLSGDLIHTSGVIDADAGTIDFNNGTEWTLPTGIFSGDISGLTVRGAGGLVLPDDSRITSTLTMLSGNLTLASGKKIEIGTNASSVGSVSWTGGSVVGKMKRWFSTSANYANNTSIDKASGIFPVGTVDYNRFAQINFTESTPGGYIEMQYLTGAPVVLDEFGAPVSDPYNLPFSYSQGGNQFIQNADATGYWEIKPFSSAGVAYASLDDKAYNLTLRINHADAFDSNPVTANPPGMRIIRAKGNPDGSHDDFVIADIVANVTTLVSQVDFTVQSDGLTGFSWFNIGGDNETPLPVELLSFSGSCEDNKTELIWKTASEYNSDYFEILKSNDGENWRVVDKQNAAGFSTSLITYSYKEEEKTTDSYYRLNQVDVNGENKLYEPIYIDCNGEASHLMTYPNPSRGGFNISLIDSKLVGEGKIIIRDAMGKIILEKSATIYDGVNLFPISSDELNPGVYFISVVNNSSNSKTVKHVMN